MICWLNTAANDVAKNMSDVFLMSHISPTKAGFYLETSSSFRRAMALYVARNRDIIKSTDFLIHNNVYLAPSKDTLK